VREEQKEIPVFNVKEEAPIEKIEGSSLKIEELKDIEIPPENLAEAAPWPRNRC